MRWRVDSVLIGCVLAAGLSPAWADMDTCSNREDRAAQIAACTAAIEDDGTTRNDLAIAYLFRCQALDLEQRYANALSDCERAAELSPVDPATHNSVAIVHLNMGQPDKALSAANTAVELLPNHGTVYNVRADAYCKLGNTDAAVKDRLDALKYGRFQPDTLQQFLKSRGFYDGAIDGAFGKGSQAALRAWTEAGCK